MPEEQVPALVALESRREAVIAVLNNGYAEDLLDGNVFEDRIARAHSATDLATLDALVSDLTLPAASAALVKASSSALTTSQPKKQLRALFSSIEKRGVWAVPSALAVSAVFGNALLDLREAELEPGLTEIHVRAVFGNLEIWVPPGVAVECDGRAIFATFEDQTSGTRSGHSKASGAASLRIVGSAIFASIEVKVRERDDRDGAHDALSERAALKLGS